MTAPRLDVQDGVTVVSFDAGPHTLDEASMDQVRDAMLTASQADPPLVLLDLSGVEFFGSAFIELMFRVWKRLQDRSGQFAVCGVSSYCSEVLTVTNLHRLWPTYERREDGVKALSAAE